MLHKFQQGRIQLYCDNSSTIKLSNNPILHGISKHIDARYHFLRDLGKDGLIELVYYRSEDQIADILTKPLKLATFVKLHALFGVCSAFVFIISIQVKFLVFYFQQSNNSSPILQRVGYCFSTFLGKFHELMSC